jgi:lysophospholipase L1-like esterase
MLECLILGDSIAVGTAQVRPECVAYATGGLNSYQWLNKNIAKSPFEAKTVIISLGSNDHKHIKTEKELRTIRQLTKADRVFWIMPSGNNPKSEVSIHAIMQTVSIVAKEFGDTVITNNQLQPDRIHPTALGYKRIAEQTKN